MADNVLDQVNFLVGADLGPYRAQLRQAEAEAQATGAKTAQAFSGATGASAQLARSQLALIEAFNKTGATSAEAIRAVGGYAAAQALLSNQTKATAAAQAILAAELKINTEAAGQAAATSNVLTGAEAKVAATTDAATVASVANTAAHVSNRAATEALVVAHEGLSGRLSRIPGSLMIMAQALGRTEAGATLFSMALNPLGLAVIAVTGTFIASTVAMFQYEEAQRKLTATSLGLGGATLLTGQQLDQAAQNAASYSDISIGAARNAAAAFAASGVSIGGSVTDANDTLSMATSTISAYAELTGQTVPEATKKLAAAIGDPAKGAAELNDQLHFLDETELQNIETLAALGNKEEAQNRLTKDFKSYTDDAAVAAGGLTSGFHEMTDGISKALDFLGKLNAQLNIFSTFAGLFPGLMGLAGNGGVPVDPAAQQGIQNLQRLRALSTAGGAAADAAGNPDAARMRDLQTMAANFQQRMAGEQALAQADPANAAAHRIAYENAAAGLAKYTNAIRTFLPEEEKRHRLAVIAAQEETLKRGDHAGRAALERQRQALEDAGTAVSQYDETQRQIDAGTKGADRGTGATHKAKVDRVAEETEKIKANTAALLAEADAYLKADSAAAMRIEAGRKAADYSATHPKADTKAMTDLFLGQDVAETAAKGAAEAQRLREQTVLRRGLDDAVAAGTLSIADENRVLQDETVLMVLGASAANAEGDKKNQLVAIIKAVTEARKANNIELAREHILSLTDEQNAKNAAVGSIPGGLSLRQRLVAQAQQKAIEDIQSAGGSVFSPAGAGLMASRARGANQQADNAGIKFVDDQTDAVDKQIDALKRQTETYGMTVQKAAEYAKFQDLMAQATKAGLVPTDALVTKLHALAAAYGTAAEASDKMAGRMSAEKSVADGLEGALESSIFDHKSLGDAMRAFGQSEAKQVFQGVMTGQGPLAGILGTGQQGGGVLNGILGPLFGLGGAAKPDGSQANPFFTKPAGLPGGVTSSGGGGIMGSIMGIFGIGGGVAGAAGAANGAGIGAALGGMFAAGGYTDPAKFYVVGEHGPELFKPGVGGTVIPMTSPGRANMSGSGGQSGPTNITHSIAIQVSGTGDKELTQMVHSAASHAVQTGIKAYDQVQQRTARPRAIQQGRRALA